jgi:hypothetical protein
MRQEKGDHSAKNPEGQAVEKEVFPNELHHRDVNIELKQSTDHISVNFVVLEPDLLRVL